MSMRNTSTEWGSLARGLHWGMAGLFVLQWLAGEFDEAFGGRGFHVSLGIVLALLLLVRLAWRLVNPLPRAVPGTSAMAALIGYLVHWAWYALLIALPITGAAYVQAKNKVVSFFGLFDLPIFIAKNRQLADLAEEAHKTLAVLALVLFAVHVAAALKHHFIDRDDVLRRMWRGAPTLR